MGLKRNFKEFQKGIKLYLIFVEESGMLLHILIVLKIRSPCFGFIKCERNLKVNLTERQNTIQIKGLKMERKVKARIRLF